MVPVQNKNLQLYNYLTNGKFPYVLNRSVFLCSYDNSLSLMTEKNKEPPLIQICYLNFTEFSKHLSPPVSTRNAENEYFIIVCNFYQMGITYQQGHESTDRRRANSTVKLQFSKQISVFFYFVFLLKYLNFYFYIKIPVDSCFRAVSTKVLFPLVYISEYNCLD